MLAFSRALLRRAREERLAQAAGSLTFATVLALVPLLAVSFALFTRFPEFRRFQQALEQHLFASLLPPEIARTILGYLTRFAANAGELTWTGSLFLLVTAVAMLLTVENAFNRLWQVRKPRALLRRVGLYLLLMALGPLALGASLWATSTVVGVSLGLVGALPPGWSFVLQLGPALLAALVLAGLYFALPNTRVRKRDALFGGVLAGAGFELGKRGFAAYLLKVPTYKAMYGAFAVFPMFLLWLYFSWLVTLAAALVAANLGRAARPARVRA